MNIAQAKCIPIPSYLTSRGVKRAYERHGGREVWYHSPLRADDRNPSFKVDTIKNVWYDYGLSDGGDIVKLVRELISCNVRDALIHLDETRLYSPALSRPTTQRPMSRTVAGTQRTKPAGQKETSEGSLELTGSSPLTHPALLKYLEQRKIDPEVGRKYLSQIDFKPPESPGSYFGVGYPAGDGFEVRNPLGFKGFVGPTKDITIHDMPEARELLVFEGFMDFLSYLSAKQVLEAQASVIVLNSTVLWQRALPYINNPRFEHVQLFLDNDTAGNMTTQRIIETTAHPERIEDKRNAYAGFDDLNHWLTSRL